MFHCLMSRVLEAVGFRAASTASASALPLPIAVILLVAIPPTKLEAPNRFQNPDNDSNDSNNDSISCMILMIVESWIAHFLS